MLKKSAPSPSTLMKWTTEFRRLRTSVKKNLCRGRPESATIPEKVGKIPVLVPTGRPMTVAELPKTAGFPSEGVFHI